MKPYLLLDIDGVLVTTPSWKQPELLEDGFMLFQKNAAANLAYLLSLAEIQLVLVSSHRHRYPIAEWQRLFANRKIHPRSITLMESILPGFPSRKMEIEAWLNRNPGANFILIDDDSSLQALEPALKSRWVQTFPLKGFDDEALEKAKILLGLM
ncbi:HAD domain-containing protein [Taibaiella koreensis]|uniref:HAD domain-containing protein n=1 Tax=Taibaiella koreensis TaxID=1268548 RepID=UPI000E5A0DA3|nr:HAD domain-containing protein [Taibaiella koreensis]